MYLAVDANHAIVCIDFYEVVQLRRCGRDRIRMRPLTFAFPYTILSIKLA